MKKRKISISVLRNKAERILLRIVPFDKKDKVIAKHFTKILRRLNRDQELRDYVLERYNESISVAMPFEE